MGRPSRAGGRGGARHDLFSVFPLSLFVGCLAAAGRLAERLGAPRGSHDGSAENGVPPAAIPIGDRLSVAAPLLGYEALQDEARRLREAEGSLADELRQAAVTIKLLQGALDPAPKSGLVTKALFHLASDENKELRERIQQLVEENRRLQDEKEVLERTAERLRAECEVLKLEMMERAARGGENGPSASAGFRTSEKMLSEFLKLVLPGIEFWPGSIRFWVEEAHNPRQTFQRLRQLSANPRDARGESVEWAPGWREQRYGKEGSTEDRLYFRHCSEAGVCYVVLSNKKQQKKGLDNLG